MQPKFDFKIQVRANRTADDPRELPWADLDPMPEFHTYGAATQWLIDSGSNRLCEYGLDFRIVPADFPCTYTAALEQTLRETAVSNQQLAVSSNGSDA